MQHPITRHGLPLGALLLAAALAGCSPAPTREPQVSVQAPLQRLDLPERPARRLSAGVNFAPAMAAAVLADDQTTQTPDAQHPRFDDGDNYGSVLVEGYPLEALGVGIEVRGVDSDNVLNELRLRGKLHLIDSGPASLALTGAYGKHSYDYLVNHTESDGFFDGYLVDEARTTIEARERDYALVAGFRASPHVLVYGGPFVYAQPYAGSHTDYDPPQDPGPTSVGGDLTGGLLGGGDSGGGSSSDNAEPVTTAFAGEVEMTGVNAGIAINLGLPELRLIAEVAHARIETGQESDETTGVSLSFRGDFGPRGD